MATPDTAIHPSPEGEKLPFEQTAADLQAGDAKALVNDADQFEEAAAPVIQETRRGYKTSEFWAGIAVALSDVLTTLPAHDKTLITILGGAYAVARGVAKNGIPNIVAPEAPKE